MQTALVCLCLLSTVLSTPVPQPLPGRATGNCMGQHRILLKGCNAKHGFYFFKYIYVSSTQSNQTQIKVRSHSTVPSHRLDEDNDRLGPTEDGVAPGQDDDTDVTESGTSLKPENRSTLDIGEDAQGAHPGAGTRAPGGVGVAVPTLASSEGSGDLDLVVEVDGDVSILPHGRRPGEAVVVNRSSVRSEDRDDGAPGGALVEGAMTSGRERAPATGVDGDEGSGKATISGQGQEGIMWGTGTRGTTLVTEKMEDIQVNTEGVREYTYIPDSSSVTVTSGKVGSTARATSFTQISPDKDGEVNILIGRANIHLGEQETTQAGATVGSKDDGIPTVGTSSPLPRLGVTVARDGSDNEGIPARRPPEGLATTATPSHGDSVTSSSRDGHPTGDNEDGATTIGDGEGPVAPGPWRVTDGDITITAETGIHGNGDGGVKGEGQRFEEMPGRPAVTTTNGQG
ncbi:ovocleidin-116, partial [Antrostomus carolinensis]|uniref:ovocleidin-116 n=1 Tax=Antrostomus carolinensis TaxID=279965 RepID=UPI0010A986F6